MVLRGHFRGISRSPRLHADTWHCCGCCPRSLCSATAAQLELPASLWYLPADGSLSMLPDTSNWGLQYQVTLDVQMAWSYGYSAVMVARISPSLRMPCRTFNSPSQACSRLWEKLTHHAAWGTPKFSPAFLLLSLAHSHLVPACPIEVLTVYFINMSIEAPLLPHSDMAFVEEGRWHFPSLYQPLKLCALWSHFLREVNENQSGA